MIIRQAEGSLLSTISISIGLMLFAYVLITFVPYPYEGVDYEPDEGVWIAVGKHYFQKFFIERDWDYASWADLNNWRFGDFGIPNPVMGKYLIGATLFLSGTVDKETVFPGYEFAYRFN